MEEIFSALFFTPGAGQLLDGERLTADDPLSSRQHTKSAAVCPWKQEEGKPDRIPGCFFIPAEILDWNRLCGVKFSQMPKGED